MVYAGCVFVAGIHLSRTLMSEYSESMWWNACVHRLDLGLYSYPKEFLGNGVRSHVNSKGKIPCTGKILLRRGSNPQRCIKPDDEPNNGATSGVTVSTSAFLACHQCCCAGFSLTWGLNLRALVCGIFWSSLLGVFSGYSGFLPSFISWWFSQKNKAKINAISTLSN